MNKMETVSFIEFRDYIERKNPKVIIYNDENNSDYMQGVKRRCYDISEPLRICLSFSKILVYFNPNIVHLKSNSGAQCPAPLCVVDCGCFVCLHKRIKAVKSFSLYTV